MKYLKQQRAWIKKKIKSGVSKEQLMQNLALFLEKNDKKIIEQKKISPKQLKRRKEFVLDCYDILYFESFN